MEKVVKDIDGNYFPLQQAGTEMPGSTMLMRLKNLDNSDFIFKILYLYENLQSAVYTKFHVSGMPSPNSYDLEVLKNVENDLCDLGWSDILSEENVNSKVLHVHRGEDGEVTEYIIS
jgi:hypothetical protein